MSILRCHYRLLPLLFMATAIFFLSHLPGSSVDLPKMPSIDKVLHAMLYALLAASALYALPPAWRAEHPAASAWLIALFCLIYGVSDEWHQSFIPGRSADALDVVADAAGGCLTALGTWLWQKKKWIGQGERLPEGTWPS